MVNVWVDGCFDLFHYGHANALRQAREFGNTLTVGCHSDEAIEHNKGPPVLPQAERARLLSACRWVTEVVPDAPYVTEVDFVKRRGMDFVVHGDDVSTDADGLDTYRLVKAAGMYKECKRTPGVSTTDAVSRILFGPSASSSALSSPSRDNLDMDLLQAFAKDPGRVEPYIRTSQMFLDDVEITAETSIPSPTKNAVLALVGPIPAGIKKVVYVEGPFDLFSADDVDFLERTAASGAPVVVGVWGPGDVRRSTGAPSVLSFQERALGVLQCKFVHGVILPAKPSDEVASLLPFQGKVEHVPRHSSSRRAIDRIEARRQDFEDRQRRKEGKSFVEAALKRAESARGTTQ